MTDTYSHKGNPMSDKLEIVGRLLALLGDDVAPSTDSPWRVGQCYMIRTVTMTWTGRLIRATSQELVLEDAAWIADTGRYHLAVTEEALSEVEPVEGPVIIGRGSVVDARTWTESLPRTVK